MTKLQNEDMNHEHKTKTIHDRWTLLSVGSFYFELFNKTCVIFIIIFLGYSMAIT